MGLTLILGGSVLIYVGVESKKKNSNVAHWLLYVLGFIGIGYGFAIMFNAYDPFSATGIIGYGLVFTILSMLVILGAGAISEVKLSKKMVIPV